MALILFMMIPVAITVGVTIGVIAPLQVRVPRPLRIGAITIGVTGLVVAFILPAPESYFSLYPAIDTVFASGYSEEHFDSLRPGMTKSEVRSLLGEPLQTFPVLHAQYPSIPANVTEGWSYSGDGACRWYDFAWLGRYVYFNAEAYVVNTEKVVHPD